MLVRRPVGQEHGDELGQRESVSFGQAGNREDTITFLGREYSRMEYQAICENLAEYFAILRTWQEKENSSEEEENL